LGKCKYCSKPAGLFRSKHAECEEQYLQRQRVIKEGRQKIDTEVLRAIRGEIRFDELEKMMIDAEKSSFFHPTERNVFLIKGWETSVDQYLDDGILDTTEEERLMEFKNHFSLSQYDLDENGAVTKTTKAAILRDILNGIIPQRISVDGDLPINLQKDEKVVWAFPGADYLEDKTRRQFVGKTQGVSIRIMKGVYYRTGGFKGHAVEHTERVHIDTGWMIVTTKNIYFAGKQKSLRIPYKKIVSFEPFSNGVGIMRDLATAKPQIFITGDGWFTYNMVVNLSQL
jgi:hypothetical protein